MEEDLGPISLHNRDPNNVQITPDNAGDFALSNIWELVSREGYWKAYRVLKKVPEYEKKHERLIALRLELKEAKSAKLAIAHKMNGDDGTWTEVQGCENAIIGDEKIRENVWGIVYQNLLYYSVFARAFVEEFGVSELISKLRNLNEIDVAHDRIVTQQAAAVTAKNSGAPGCNF